MARDLEKRKAYQKKWRAEHAEYLREYSQEEHRISSAEQREKYPDEIKARSVANHAIRDGKITPQPCEVCGAEKVQAHHDDYNYPLKVRWLCVKHHAEWHIYNKPIRVEKGE